MLSGLVMVAGYDTCWGGRFPHWPLRSAVSVSVTRSLTKSTPDRPRRAPGTGLYPGPHEESTGQLQDVAKRPGENIRLMRPMPDGSVFLVTSPVERYRLDLRGRALRDADMVAGSIVLHGGGNVLGKGGRSRYSHQTAKSIMHDGREIGRGALSVRVSPDGRRVIWSREGRLWYYDSGERAPRVMSEGQPPFLWFREQDMH